MAPLIAGGIVRSTKGPKGGVSLAKDPASVKLSDVIPLLEGPMTPVECVDNPKICPRHEFCVTRDIWGKLKEAIDGVLEATTLQELVDRQLQKGRP
jgi:Rrf2 family protein